MTALASSPSSVGYTRSRRRNEIDNSLPHSHYLVASVARGKLIAHTFRQLLDSRTQEAEEKSQPSVSDSESREKHLARPAACWAARVPPLLYR